MEFLDDLRHQRESGHEPEEQEPDDSQHTQDSGETLGEDAWENLIAGVAYDEPASEAFAANDRGARTRGAMSPLQKAVLGGLALTVLLIWGGLALIVFRELDGGAIPGVPLAPAAATSESTAKNSPEDASQPAMLHPIPTEPPTVTPMPGAAASTRFDRQIEKEPDNPQLYLRRGQEYLAMGAHEAALRDFENVLSLGSDAAEAYVGLGCANFHLWRWREAETAFSIALEIGPVLSDAYLGLGRLYYHQGNYGEAAKAYDQAAEINPHDAEAEAWLAIASARRGDLTEALDAVTRAIAQDDRLAIVYVAQSWARRVEDPPDIDGAQGDLLYATELQPNAFLTLNALAQFYVDFRPERLVEAEQLAIYAHNWAADDIARAVALQTLGRVYLEQGRTADAQRVLEEAAMMATRDGRIALAGLADDLARAGK